MLWSICASAVALYTITLTFIVVDIFFCCANAYMYSMSFQLSLYGFVKTGHIFLIFKKTHGHSKPPGWDKNPGNQKVPAVAYCGTGWELPGFRLWHGSNFRSVAAAPSLVKKKVCPSVIRVWFLYLVFGASLSENTFLSNLINKLSC